MVAHRIRHEVAGAFRRTQMKRRLFTFLFAAVLAFAAGTAIAGAMRLFAPARASSLSLSPLTPMGSGFFYQGRLTDGGLPANGNYDFVFTLGGSIEGTSVLTQTNRPVNNGLFT